MLPDDQIRALEMLEHGRPLNTLSILSRELIAAGLAMEDFGYLRITEAGRVALRRRFVADDGHVADLFSHAAFDPARYPMGKPEDPPAVVAASEEFISALEEYLPDAADVETRALRAAGVASGETGTWVDEKWVKAFVREFVKQ